MASTALRFGGILIVLPSMLLHLSTAEVGLWYMFLSFASCAFLFDIAVGVSAVRATAYLWGGSSDIQSAGISKSNTGGDMTINRPLFANLCATLRVYYAVIALGVLLLAGVGGGIWIVHQTDHLPHATSMRLAWVLFAVGTSYATYTALWYVLLQGVNGVRQVQQSFVVALTANYLLTLLGLHLGWGLWAPVVGNFLQGAISRNLQRRHFIKIVSPVVGEWHRGRVQFDIIKRLWPQGWRNAVANFGVYLSLSAGTLVASWVGGLKDAASYGLSFQLCFAAIQIASIPFIVKLPLITQWRASGQIHAIRKIVRDRVLIFWVLATCAGITLICLGSWLLHHVVHTSTPLLPPSTLLLLYLFVTLEGNQGIFRELYITTNQNPFVLNILITGIFIFGLSLFLAPRFGILGIVLAQLVPALLLNNWYIPFMGLKSIRPQNSRA